MTDTQREFEKWFEKEFPDLDTSNPEIHKGKSNMAYGWQAALAHSQQGADSVALEVSRKIMVEVGMVTMPVDYKRMPQLQAKIQCLIAEAITNRKDE